MGSGNHSEDESEQTMRGRHLRRGSLHARHSDAGVHAGEQPECGQDRGVGRNAGLEDGGREAIERQRRVAAEIAERRRVTHQRAAPSTKPAKRNGRRSRSEMW